MIRRRGMAAGLLTGLLALSIGSGTVVLGAGTGVIRGIAFDDLNGNGDRDSGEPGVPETVICLVREDRCDFTEFGEYEFDLLAPGTYRVRLVDIPSGYHVTRARTVRVELAEGELERVNFPLRTNTLTQ